MGVYNGGIKAADIDRLKPGDLWGTVPFSCPYCSERLHTTYFGKKIREMECEKPECKGNIAIGRLEACPSCNSENIQMREHLSPVKGPSGRVFDIIDVYRCGDCGLETDVNSRGYRVIEWRSNGESGMGPDLMDVENEDLGIYLYYPTRFSAQK